MDRRISPERSVSTGLQDAPFIPLHPSLIAFIPDALQGSWFGADKGQLDPFTQLHSLVARVVNFAPKARGKGTPPPDQRPAKVCLSLR